MKSSYLTNLLLILLVAGLYWFNNQSDTTIGSDLQPLTALASSEIQRITIERINRTNIVLEKPSSDWQLTQPLTARANNTRIKFLLSLLTTSSHAKLDASNNDSLEQFGLAPAKVTLILNDHKFHFGDVEAISTHRYILFDGSIHLIDDQVSHLLNASPASFIDNRLIYADNVIRKLTLPILNANNTLTDDYADIEYQQGQWQSNDTLHTTDQLTTLVDIWQHAYALQVLPIKEQPPIDSHKITIWYKNTQQPAQFNIVLTDKAVSIYDLQQQLKYQFPAVLAQQLLPIPKVIGNAF